MKRITCVVLGWVTALLIALMPALSFATDFFIEDDSMTGLPKPLEETDLIFRLQ